MKTTFLKTTLALALSLMFNYGFAQTSQSTSYTKPATNTSATGTTKQSEPKPQASVTHHAQTKEQWMKHYNEMKPRVDAMASNAKVETKNPQFSAEARKLDQLATVFKSKIDNMDKVVPDKKDAYDADMRASHKALNEQYIKVKGMWDKMHPADVKKAAPSK